MCDARIKREMQTHLDLLELVVDHSRFAGDGTKDGDHLVLLGQPAGELVVALPRVAQVLHQVLQRLPPLLRGLFEALPTLLCKYSDTK